MKRGRQKWIKEGSGLAFGAKTLHHLRIDKAHAAQNLYTIMADPKSADHVDENYVTTADLIGRWTDTDARLDALLTRTQDTASSLLENLESINSHNVSPTLTDLRENLITQAHTHDRHGHETDQIWFNTTSTKAHTTAEKEDLLLPTTTTTRTTTALDTPNLSTNQKALHAAEHARTSFPAPAREALRTQPHTNTTPAHPTSRADKTPTQQNNQINR